MYYAPTTCGCCRNKAYYNHNIGAWKCWRCGCLNHQDGTLHGKPCGYGKPKGN